MRLGVFQIYKALTSIGFPEDFCGLIKNLYNNNTTSFSVKGQLSKEIHIEKGVRQGCPLSPLLFNICLDPLLKLIRKENNENGYFVNGKSYCIQAFADDVISMDSFGKSAKGNVLFNHFGFNVENIINKAKNLL